MKSELSLRAVFIYNVHELDDDESVTDVFLTVAAVRGCLLGDAHHPILSGEQLYLE